MAANPGTPPAPSSPTALAGMSPQQQQQLSKRRSIRQEFHTRNRYYIAERPPVLSAVILDGGWVNPLLQFSAVLDFRRWCCLRCSTVQQSAILAHEQQPLGYENEDFSSIVETDDCLCWWTRENRKRTCVLLSLISFIDAVTFGLPCGPLYPGMGTVCLGCQTRWNVRKKYRLKGFGYEDCCAYVLTPMCAVNQQATEMQLRGIPEPPNPCFMVVN